MPALSETEWIAAQGPMPTAEEIALPLMRAIYALHEIGERAEATANAADEDPALVSDAVELGSRIQRAAQLCGAAAQSCCLWDDGPAGAAAGIETMFKAVTRVSRLDEHTRSYTFDLVCGAEL